MAITVVNALTKARMLAIEAKAIISGSVNAAGDLILTARDGSTVAAGNIKGPKGDPGATSPPSGNAGGDLTGTYPNPSITSALKDAAATVASLRTLGKSATQAAAGDHDHTIPYLKLSLNGVTISANTNIGGSVLEDSESGWDVSAKAYTVKKAGVYRLSCRFQVGGSTTNVGDASGLKNNSVGEYLFGNGSAPGYASVSGYAEIRCVAGDTLSLRTSLGFTTNNAPAPSSAFNIIWLRP